MRKKKFKYDIAISYAEEDYEYVSQVAEELITKRVDIFYDLHEKVNTWGKDLYQHLHNVYSDQAKYTIIFISKHYAQKLWTSHELKSAQSRALTENREYILPVRFDSTKLPGMSSSTAYLELSDISPSELANLIISKLNRSDGSPSAPKPIAPASAWTNWEFLFIKSDDKLIKLKKDDILYLESMRDYVKFVTIGKNYITYNTLKSMEEKLIGRTFIKVHPSYIVNISKIDDIKNNTLYLLGYRIPIGKRYWEELVTHLHIL